MDKKDFANRVSILFEDRNLEIPSSGWLDLLSSMSKNYSDENIIDGFSKLMKVSVDSWNQRYGYNSHPPIVEFEKFFSAKEPSFKDKLSNQKASKALQNEIDEIIGKLKFKLDNLGKNSDRIQIDINSSLEKEGDKFILHTKPHIMKLTKKYNVLIKECGIDEIRLFPNND